MATLKQITTAVAAYVDAAKMAGVWTPTTANLAGLLDKIGKTYTINGNFEDKLLMFDGEDLPLGKTIEEYYQDLNAVITYNDYKTSDTNAAQNALKPYYPSYRPCCYSYTLGRRVIPTTIKFNEYERASINEQAFINLFESVLTRLNDSYKVARFNIKKEMLSDYADKAINLMTSTSQQAGETAAPVQYHASSTTTAASKALTIGNRYYIGASLAAKTNLAICVKTRTATTKTWEEQINEGYLVELDLIDTTGAPTDTTTGEAFVKLIKKDVETAQFINDGHSLNGNTIGATDGLYLIVKKGIKPILDVEVEAGAFNPDKLAIPAEIVVVDNFGSNNNGVYAMLIDKRGCKLHQDYYAVREQNNGEGDFINYFLHYENTAFVSKNTFIKVYK